jgi:hypothetical protein
MALPPYSPHPNPNFIFSIFPAYLSPPSS